MRILYLPNHYSQQRQKEKPANIYPVRMAMEAEWYRQRRHEVVWNKIEDWNEFNKVLNEPENLPFLSLPRPDRVFTQAKKYTSGNYKYLPGTHILSASGCWWGKCSFCVEKGQPYEVRPVEDVVSEIEECKALGFREVFDDSGTFPTGRWLDEFCTRIKDVGIRFSCNLRLVDLDYGRLRQAGFRMLLFGVESANQETLDRINKGVKVEDIKYIIRAAEEGLEPHIAVMFGYPWETDEDAVRTLGVVHYLLRKGYAKTAQASLYCPPDGVRNEAHKKYVKRIYRAAYYPDFWFNKLKEIRNIDDIKYIWRGIKTACQI
jgi:radical SAM superfamily enzyme YgiQ (UPF0313 family)